MLFLQVRGLLQVAMSGLMGIPDPVESGMEGVTREGVGMRGKPRSSVIVGSCGAMGCGSSGTTGCGGISGSGLTGVGTMVGVSGE